MAESAALPEVRNGVEKSRCRASLACSCFFSINPTSITGLGITHLPLMTTFSIEQIINGNPRSRMRKNEVAPPRTVIPKLVTSQVDGFHRINRIHDLLFSEQNQIYFINN